MNTCRRKTFKTVASTYSRQISALNLSISFLEDMSLNFLCYDVGREILTLDKSFTHSKLYGIKILLQNMFLTFGKTKSQFYVVEQMGLHNHE